ncbi:GW dipeptide domain-containing protein [Oenococcus sp.]|uniref:GW dipeptide domain-containing protein n=1 Tax=Oenococcus sp. TaxID=1979414 RepID=UPI0039EAF81E
MKEKRNQFKKYLLLIVLTSSTAIADTELPALPFQKHNFVYAASNAFASLSRRAASYSAVIVQDGRDDGVFFNGPALTSSSTQTPNARGSQYLNTVVQVQEIDTTRRSNGSIYEYAKILDNGRTFWIDLRAVFRLDTVLSTQSLNVGTVYLNQDDRNDGVYFNGPALTSANTLKPDAQGSQYNGDSVRPLQIKTTKRNSNGQTYTYVQVQDGSRRYWIDVRAVFDQILSTSTATSLGYIDQSSRSDSFYEGDSPLTSLSSMTRAGSAVSFNQDPVTIQRTRVQKRGNGNTYTYVYVYDQNKRRSYWIDKRAVTPYASISPATVLNNVTAYINQSERNDGIYSRGPALTSADTMSADGKASSYDGDLVQVQRIVTTQRGSSQTPYQYAQVKDGTKTFWIDVRALFDTVTSTSNTQSNGYIDQYGRSDGVYNNGAPFTNASSFAPNTNAAAYNNDPVTIQKTSIQKRANGNTYVYVYVYDQTQKRSFWIDQRAISTQTLSYDGLSAAQQQWLASTAPYAAQVAGSNNLYASIMLAQAILESGWASSDLSQNPNNNFFGIKYSAAYPSIYASGKVLMSTWEEDRNGGLYQTSAYFNTYATVTNSFLDYVRFLKAGTRYQNMFRNPYNSYVQAANNLVADGYATDSKYAGKLIGIIQSYHLDVLDGR